MVAWLQGRASSVDRSEAQMAFAFVLGLLTQSATVEPQPVQPAAEKPKAARVCVLADDVTGTHMRRKVCRDQWGVTGEGPHISSGAPTSGMTHAAKSFGSLSGGGAFPPP
jgi:hypothetical protein